MSSELVPLGHRRPATGAPDYERMRLTLANCSRVDELAGLADLAEEMQAYYKQAQDAAGEIRFARIRIRLERCLGQALKEAAANAERARSRGATSALTLSVLGIARDRVSRAMQLADLPPEIELAQPNDPAGALSVQENYSQPWSFEEFVRDG